jgi:hypothetical protein
MRIQGIIMVNLKSILISVLITFNSSVLLGAAAGNADLAISQKRSGAKIDAPLDAREFEEVEGVAHMPGAPGGPGKHASRRELLQRQRDDYRNAGVLPPVEDLQVWEAAGIALTPDEQERLQSWEWAELAGSY